MQPVATEQDEARVHFDHEERHCKMDELQFQVTRLLTDAVGTTCDQRLQCKMKLMYILMTRNGAARRMRCSSRSVIDPENDDDMCFASCGLGTATTCVARRCDGYVYTLVEM